ncbi:MAG: hypothetical protein ACREDS_12550, partial [Limisphaerales bacterium]
MFLTASGKGFCAENFIHTGDGWKNRLLKFSRAAQIHKVRKGLPMSDEVLNRQQFFNKPICVALAATQTSGKADQPSSY